MVEALHTDYSVRHICDVLGFNRSSLYYQPKHDPIEQVLRDEIEQLAARYPKYGYRRITHLLLRMGYSVGYTRVARLMREENLLVAVKPLNRCAVIVNGTISLRTLTSVAEIRFGSVTLLMSDSRDNSSMFRC